MGYNVFSHDITEMGAKPSSSQVELNAALLVTLSRPPLFSCLLLYPVCTHTTPDTCSQCHGIAEGEWDEEGTWIGGKDVLLDGRRFTPEQLSDTSSLHAHGAKKEPTESPVHRLRDCNEFWEKAMRETGIVCSFTMSIILHGYKLEWRKEGQFKGPAPPVWQPNHKSAFDHKEFISGAIAEGLLQGTIRETSADYLKCIMPLGVAEHSRTKKKRQIFDARHLNQYLVDIKFKMESLHIEGRSLFQDCSWGGTIDLSSAYYHIDMHESAQAYLGFEWEGRFYCYTVLPFGLSTAPRIFTMVMKTPVAYLRFLGCKFIVYLDDLPFGNKTISLTSQQAKLMVDTLRKFGWIIQLSKCVGVDAPVQTFESLGYVINLDSKMFLVPLAKVQKFVEVASSILRSERIEVLLVAKAKGLLSSMWMAVGEHARIRTRALDRAIESRLNVSDNPTDKRTWRRKIQLTSDTKKELIWWLSNLSKVNGRPIRGGLIVGSFDGVLSTDASSDGFGGWVSADPPHHRLLSENMRKLTSLNVSAKEATRASVQGWEISGPLPKEIVGQSSSSCHKEMYGAYMVLRLLAPLLRGGNFRLHMDNIACVIALGGKVPERATGGKPAKSVLGGSSIPEIQNLVIDILDLATDHKIQLTPIWIPRAQNERSDLLSRLGRLAHFEYHLY